jgi:hypothetical protein
MKLSVSLVSGTIKKVSEVFRENYTELINNIDINLTGHETTHEEQSTVSKHTLSLYKT